MAGSMTDGVIERRDFSKIATQVEIPNLIDIQRRSYDRFLQRDASPQERDDIGLQAAFTSVFPIVDYNETAMIEFLDYARHGQIELPSRLFARREPDPGNADNGLRETIEVRLAIEHWDLK